MAKYMVVASYSTEGMSGVINKGGTGRRDAIAKMVEGLGGKMESFYFAFGDDDVYTVVDLPDNVTAAAVGMTVSATGMVRAKTIVLLTPEEVDQAGKAKVAYTPPGS